MAHENVVCESITKNQFKDLKYATSIKEFHQLLEEYAGIIARPYTAYQYFDSSGDYVGESGESGLVDLLRNAYIEVVDDGK